MELSKENEGFSEPFRTAVGGSGLQASPKNSQSEFQVGTSGARLSDRSGIVGAPKELNLESLRAPSVLKVEDLRSSDRRDSLEKPRSFVDVVPADERSSVKSTNDEFISHINLNIDIHNFSLANVFFLDTKRNIIMDGNFTKIIYSNHFFSMNSIFLYFPIEVFSAGDRRSLPSTIFRSDCDEPSGTFGSSTEKPSSLNKKFIKFNPCIPKNASLIQDISKIETRILEYFKIYSNINVRNSNLLSKQLNTGNIKIYQEYSYSCDNTFNKRSLSRDGRLDTTLDVVRTDKQGLVRSSEDEEKEKTEFVIKISGIWENYEEIGLTYKILEQRMFR